jgi:hypothetical protein
MKKKGCALSKMEKVSVSAKHRMDVHVTGMS